MESLTEQYFKKINVLLSRIIKEERNVLDAAASRMADQISADRLIFIYGPGGHSNIATQEVFFRAGGLAYMSAIFDGGTLLSNGALRSVAMERTPGYGAAVIADHQLTDGDLLLLVSAYGVNSALIDAALEARSRGVFVIGISSHEHAASCALDHPARHRSKHNLQDLVDIAIDSKIPSGDALVEIPGFDALVGPASSFANIFALNALMVETAGLLTQRKQIAPIWRSINAATGDQVNQKLIAQLKGRIRSL